MRRFLRPLAVKGLVVVAVLGAGVGSFAITSARRGDVTVAEGGRTRDGEVIEPTRPERILEDLESGRLDAGDLPTAGAPSAIRAAFAMPPAGPLMLGRIRIPDVGLDVEYRNGVHVSVLEQGPGHWPGTPFPGAPGNAVISGHRTTFTKPFADLEKLQPGDVVETSLAPAAPVTYRVARTEIIPEAQYAEVALRQPADPAERSLTLFACHPEGSRRFRILVTALADPVPQQEVPAPPGA